MNKLELRDIVKEILSEKKKKRDRCLRIADRKFDKPSAYKSGAVVRCRKGDIWKGLKEENKYMYNLAGNCVTGLDDPYFQNNVCSDATEMAGIVDEFSNEFMTGNEFISKVNWPFDKLGNVEDTIYDFAYNPGKDIYWAYNIEDDVHFFFIKDRLNENYKDYIIVKNIKENDLGYSKLKEELIREKVKETLRTWFKRSGTPGKEGGWVDCNAPIRKDGKITGYKACGRKKEEKRSKYPSCRPTAAKCKDPGKGTKWGKTK